MPESQNTVRKPRRQYKKGLVRAQQYLVDLAAKLHEKQVGSSARADGTRSTDVLGRLVDIAVEVYGGTSETAQLMSKLADYHGDFGEHRSSSNLLEGVVEFHRLDGDELSLADSLRKLSNSYGKDGRGEESINRREEARHVLTQMLQNSPALSVFETLVRDEAIATSDCPKLPVGTNLDANVKEPLRGEVFWTRLPMFPEDPHQPRPTVVVSPSRHNAKSSAVTVAPIYSNRNNGHRHNLLIPRSTPRITEGSIIQCNRLITLEKTLLRGEPICKLPADVITEVLRLAGDALAIGQSYD
jgi:Growth inhibitor